MRRLETVQTVMTRDPVTVWPDTPFKAVHELTGGLGADLVIEAVGVPETFEQCTRLVRPGGHVALKVTLTRG